MTDGQSREFLVDGKYGITDLVSIERLRDIFQKFSDATGYTIGFLDHPAMNLLITAGWRDICTKYHRCNPKAQANCLKSNRRLLDALDTPGKTVIEECDNGLVDCAVPIIIRGKHIASLATGQLLFAPPDIERFKKQAAEFGIDEAEYLAALRQVSVFEREKVEKVTAFLGDIAAVVSELGLANLEIKEDGVRLAGEIEERKQAERLLRDAQENLENRVKERTADIEAFCYSASHDLRSTLRSINIFSRMLIDDCGKDLGGTALDYAQRIQRASTQTNLLMEGLLQFYMTDKSALRPEPLDLSAMAADVLAELKNYEPERTVETVIEPGMRADGDRELVKILLLNLLGNAWKFTAGKAGARIEFGAADVEGRRTFCVRDNGAGFERTEGLFLPFRRFHRGSEFPGSGLGLAIVRRIILRHGGNIRAESAPGQGAVFYFTI